MQRTRLQLPRGGRNHVSIASACHRWLTSQLYMPHLNAQVSMFMHAPSAMQCNLLCKSSPHKAIETVTATSEQLVQAHAGKQP